MSSKDQFNGSAESLAQSIERLMEIEDANNDYDAGVIMWPNLTLPPINLWSFPASWKQQTKPLTVNDLLSAAAARLKQPDGWHKGVEAVAKMIEKKADEFALEHGHDDMGALSFGTGSNAIAKDEYHSNLLELAEEIRAMVPPDNKPEYKHIDWNEISERGLLVRINREIMHPLGLSVFRDPATGESGGALIAPDGAWDYPLDQEPADPHVQLKQFYDVKDNNALIEAQAKHIEKLQDKLAQHRAPDPFPTSPRQG